jgi:hypothetical protein
MISLDVFFPDHPKQNSGATLLTGCYLILIGCLIGQTLHGIELAANEQEMLRCKTMLLPEQKSKED